jgi:malate dehydrogenase
VHYTEPEGTAEELASLKNSYEHLVKMREEIVGLGIVPAVEDWKNDNANL